jgi:RES domain-containing protein
MQIFRLTRKKYKIELSGKGAAVMGARWNSKGTELIYTSASRALAMAEVFIHLSLNKLPSDFVMLEINIPETLKMGTVTAKELPERWNEFPYRFNTQQFGDGLVSDNNYAFLQVPSAVVPGDFNYLLNPYHADFSKITIKTYTDFPMDNRLFKI